jgi:hypothetical protein
MRGGIARYRVLGHLSAGSFPAENLSLSVAVALISRKTAGPFPSSRRNRYFTSQSKGM